MTATLPLAPPRAANPVQPLTGGQLQVRLIGERRQAFRLAGSGAPLVLLHGVGDCSATWDPVLPALAKRHFVIAPDLPGHGLSDTSEDDVGAVRDLLRDLGIGRATVVGHSLGGAVAWRFAQQCPQLLDRLVLVSGATPTSTLVWRALTLPGAAAALRLLALPSMRLPAGAVAALLRAAGAQLGEDAAGLLRMIDAQPDAAAFVDALRTALAEPADGAAPGVPTLLLWGEHDAVVPLAHARRAQQAMPGSRLDVLAGAGHFPFHTDPVRFVARLVDFLDPPIQLHPLVEPQPSHR